jgi:hypothetical protein
VPLDATGRLVGTRSTMIMVGDKNLIPWLPVLWSSRDGGLG